MAVAKKKTVAAPTRARKPAATKRAKPKAAASASAAAHDDAGKNGEAVKAEKPHKVKVLRDSFTMPKTEFAVLQALKQRATDGGRPAKKSEVLRAGVLALAEMGDAAFLAAMASVPAVKTGRPTKA